MNSIEILFEWLLAASLRASVLAVVVLGIQFVLRHRLPAAWRHALWLPMLAVLVLPVLPEAPFALFPQKSASPVLTETAVKPAAPAVSTAPVAPPDSTLTMAADLAPALPAAPTPVIEAAPAPTSNVNFLAILWLAGAGAVLGAGWIGYHRTMRRIRATAATPDRMLLAAIAEAAHEAGLSRAPRTWVSAAVSSPAVTGFLRPLLLLPAGFPAGFSATETRLILLHEFSHLKRLDLPLNWLMCLLQAMHWFNPLLWFAFARMRADRESACDARVLSIDATDRRAEYGCALLKLQCAAPSQALSLGFVGIFEKGSEIKARIREISAHRPGCAAWRFTGASILTLLMVFGVTKGQDAEPIIHPQKAGAESDRLFLEGVKAYAKEDFQTSVDKFRAALSTLPEAPTPSDHRATYTKRLADASVALAQQFRKVGKYDEARSTLKGLLAKDPENALAKTELGYLADPIHTNPALTYEHTKNIDEVRHSLYMAQGYYDLGKYDEAKKEYEAVLRIDPYNTAAKRGMEMIAAAKAEESGTVINILSDGTIKIGGGKVDLTQLHEKLASMAAQNKNQPVAIRRDGEVTYKRVVEVIDTCQNAGIWNISFATLKPEPSR